MIISNAFYAQYEKLKSHYEVIYRVKFASDTLTKGDIKEEDLSLLIKDNQSLFKSTMKAVNDSVSLAVTKKAFENPIDGKAILDMRTVPNVNFKSEVFLTNGKQTVYKELLRNRFSYVLEDPIVWEIGKETKLIGTYSCKKATGTYKNRNFTAWFAEEISIPDGPYVFKGLPGLVLEVYDKLDSFRFSMISFKKVEKPMVLMEDAFSTTYQAYSKARQNFLDNPAATISNQTGLNLTPSNMSRINDNARRFKNYID